MLGDKITTLVIEHIYISNARPRMLDSRIARLGYLTCLHTNETLDALHAND